MVQIFSHVVNIPFLLGVGNDALPVHGFGPQGSTGDHSDPLQVSKDWAFRMARFQGKPTIHCLMHTSPVLNMKCLSLLPGLPCGKKWWPGTGSKRLSFSPWQEMLGGKNRHQHEALKRTAPKAIEWQARKNHEKTHIFVGQELRPSHSVFFDGILHRWRSQGHVGMASCTFKTISLTHHQLPNSLVAVVNIMQRVVRLIFGRWNPKKTYSASSGADRKLWIGFIRCWPKYEAKKLINV